MDNPPEQRTSRRIEVAQRFLMGLQKNEAGMKDD